MCLYVCVCVSAYACVYKYMCVCECVCECVCVWIRKVEAEPGMKLRAIDILRLPLDVLRELVGVLLKEFHLLLLLGQLPPQLAQLLHQQHLLLVQGLEQLRAWGCP